MRRPLQRLVRQSDNALKLVKSFQNPLSNYARFLDALGPSDFPEMLGLRRLQCFVSQGSRTSSRRTRFSQPVQPRTAGGCPLASERTPSQASSGRCLCLSTPGTAVPRTTSWQRSPPPQRNLRRGDEPLRANAANKTTYTCDHHSSHLYLCLHHSPPRHCRGLRRGSHPLKTRGARSA